MNIYMSKYIAWVFTCTLSWGSLRSSNMSVLFVLKDFIRTLGGVLFVFYKYINLVRGILPAPWCFHHSSVDTAVFCLAELRPPGYFCPHQRFHSIVRHHRCYIRKVRLWHMLSWLYWLWWCLCCCCHSCSLFISPGMPWSSSDSKAVPSPSGKVQEIASFFLIIHSLRDLHKEYSLYCVLHIFRQPFLCLFCFILLYHLPILHSSQAWTH